MDNLRWHVKVPLHCPSADLGIFSSHVTEVVSGKYPVLHAFNVHSVLYSFLWSTQVVKLPSTIVAACATVAIAGHMIPETEQVNILPEDRIATYINQLHFKSIPRNFV